MKVTAEATIDIDEKRKVWVSLDAEVETADDFHKLSAAASEAALNSFQKAGGRVESEGARIAREAKERQEVQEQELLRGMGELS